MATLRITEKDRDAQGRIIVEPRSLADLLPTPASIKASAQPQPWTRQEKIGAGIFALAVCLFLLYAWQSGARVRPAMLPPAVISTPTVYLPQVAVGTAPTATPVTMLDAYAAPNGVLLGPIEESRSMRPVARYGDGWVQMDVQGSGLVWLRAGDVQADLAALRDLTPPTPAPYRAPIVVPTSPPAPSNWYTDIATPEPAFVEALIGEDPNALACNGHPWCGGLTNAEAREAVKK